MFTLLGTTYITALMNLSLTTLQIPSVRKSGKIIPIRKPNKPADHSTSFRPTPLLSPIANFIEALLLPSLRQILKAAPHNQSF